MLHHAERDGYSDLAPFKWEDLSMVLRDARMLALFCFSLALAVAYGEAAKPGDRSKTERATVAAEQARIKAEHKQLTEDLHLLARRLEKSTRMEDIRRAKDVHAALEESDSRCIEEKMEAVCQLLDKENLADHRKALSKAKEVAVDLEVVYKYKRILGIGVVAIPQDYDPGSLVVNGLGPDKITVAPLLKELCEAQRKLVGVIEELYEKLL